ncbi:hypothetical protein VP01_607g1 [Puccinia sorghi]|uniref:Uncharacterized protein n=1 Tax=Puccinia sorghi TaxID=27349 RepID=A0A0L6UH52_9BASI|nr:hypothetical protein VP01_607g1 [Puccinia sorghi]
MIHIYIYIYIYNLSLPDKLPSFAIQNMIKQNENNVFFVAPFMLSTGIIIPISISLFLFLLLLLKSKFINRYIFLNLLKKKGIRLMRQKRGDEQEKSNFLRCAEYHFSARKREWTSSIGILIFEEMMARRLRIQRRMRYKIKNTNEVLLLRGKRRNTIEIKVERPFWEHDHNSNHLGLTPKFFRNYSIEELLLDDFSKEKYKFEYNAMFVADKVYYTVVEDVVMRILDTFFAGTNSYNILNNNTCLYLRQNDYSTAKNKLILFIGPAYLGLRWFGKLRNKNGVEGMISMLNIIIFIAQPSELAIIMKNYPPECYGGKDLSYLPMENRSLEGSIFCLLLWIFLDFHFKFRIQVCLIRIKFQSISKFKNTSNSKLNSKIDTPVLKCSMFQPSCHPNSIFFLTVHKAWLNKSGRNVGVTPKVFDFFVNSKIQLEYPAHLFKLLIASFHIRVVYAIDLVVKGRGFDCEWEILHYLNLGNLISTFHTGENKYTYMVWRLLRGMFLNLTIGALFKMMENRFFLHNNYLFMSFCFIKRNIFRINKQGLIYWGLRTPSSPSLSIQLQSIQERSNSSQYLQVKGREKYLCCLGQGKDETKYKDNVGLCNLVTCLCESVRSRLRRGLGKQLPRIGFPTTRTQGTSILGVRAPIHASTLGVSTPILEMLLTNKFFRGLEKQLPVTGV